MDRIDEKVPVYKLVDPLDKIVPSFALVLILIALVLVFGMASVFSMIFPANGVISIQVLDQNDSPLPNAAIRILDSDGTELFSGTTDESGNAEQKTFAPGTEIEIEVLKDGYLPHTELVTLNAGQTAKNIYLDETLLRELTILLKDEYSQPIRDAISLNFTCKNPNVQAPSSITVSTGQTTIIEPANCNGLIVRVEDADKYNLADSIEITTDTQTIYLSEVRPDEGLVRTELRFNGQLISDIETVYLYKENGELDGTGPIDSKTTASGIAEFSRVPGTYFVKTAGAGRFGTTESTTFTLSANAQETIALELVENIVGQIKLKIVNSRNNAAIDDALVSLKIGAEDAAPSRTTDSNGMVEFGVTTDTEHTAIIDHEDYCYKTVKVSMSSSVQTIELDTYTRSCGGELKIKVLNQSASPIKNATISLHNGDGYSLGYRNKTTDLNGIATFTGVKSGDYKGFAFKGTSSGWSEVEHFIERASDKTLLTVVLTVPDGTIRARVLDEDGNPLQFAQVAFVEVVDNKPVGGGSLPVEDINGTVDLVTSADKRVYIIASKEGYANYTSVPYTIVPETVQEITAVLEKEIISGEIEARFVGIFNESGNTVSVLSPGKKYKARFQLVVPEFQNYDSIGMHIRTGSYKIIELDKIVLKELNIPGRASVVRATSFNEEIGYENDVEFVSSDEAKWANIRWGNFVPGIINVEAEVRVKETAKVIDKLAIHYRAWGEEDNEYARDPVDETLGNSAGVDQSLYANAHSEIYQVGAETVCDDKFCFSATIVDLSEDLAQSVTEGYAARIFREYKLNFTILNNSEFDTDSYINAEIRLVNENESILLNNYTITGAQGTAISGTAADSETEWISIGDLLPNRSVRVETNFTPQKTGAAPLLIEIRAGQRIRFSKILSISASAGKQFDVVVAPELLPSGIENKITATVKEQATTLEVDEARVKIKDKFGDVLAEKLTNSKGIAILTLPALAPGEKLFLQVGKYDFELFEMELNVDEKIVAIKPARVGIALNAKTKTEGEAKFSVENRTSFDIEITDLELEGRFKGLLDEERIQNWLYTLEGEKIKAGEEKDYSLKAFLSDAGKRIPEAKTLQGNLQVKFSAYQSIWEFEVPTTISIGLGGEVDEPTCFNITRKEWSGFTEGNPIEIEFEIENNCSVDSIPVTLRDIETKIAWQGNSVGEFELRTEQAGIELRSGYFRRFAPQLAPGESISVVLSFSPDAGVDGLANAEINFRATNPTDGKKQFLTDKLLAEITSINLIDCIYIDKEVLVIEPQKSGSFGIETVGCGETTPLKLVSDELTISSSKLVMQAKDSKEIEVLAERNMPGQYPIQIYAQGQDQTDEKLIKTVRVRITSGKCLDLTKYEFDIFDDINSPYDGFDTTEIINRCYDRPVEIHVEWDEHDWMDAIKVGALVGLVMGLAGGVMAVGDDRSFFMGEENEEEVGAQLGAGVEQFADEQGNIYTKKGNQFYDKNGRAVPAPTGKLRKFTAQQLKDGTIYSGYSDGKTITDARG
ncbi:MAG: carboxypeptidase-like regulatory domain-containing protein, partial [archaeon]|nr:carboxypeptidase-like regulatory domain-containing protein [archaeon]